MSGKWQIIDITPEPTPEERDAIIAALTVLADMSDRERTGATSRWREAAKRESLRGAETDRWHQGRKSRWNHGPGHAISASRLDFSPLDR
jgi:hypothetical protein